MKGEYANAFNKFHPKKVEVNEATVEEAIKYGHFLKRSEEDIAEAIDTRRQNILRSRRGKPSRPARTTKTMTTHTI